MVVSVVVVSVPVSVPVSVSVFLCLKVALSADQRSLSSSSVLQQGCENVLQGSATEGLLLLRSYLEPLLLLLTTFTVR